MLFLLFHLSDSIIFACLGAIFALVTTFLLLRFGVSILPVDHGRAFAVEGGQSKGKPTGAGLLFITVFVLSAFLFVPVRLENILFFVFIEAAMITGYLDDGSTKPWSEYKKGILDLLISFLTAFTFATFSSREIIMPFIGRTYNLPFAFYLILGTVLVWVAINVTNCTDGVDGLSSSLTIISLLSILFLSFLLGTVGSWSYVILIMIAVLLAYLWYNTNPSQLLMGDAGSRALGVFLAISIMQTHQPFAYLILCSVFILDGGAGIVKISLKRFLHISILKNTITPFHDHLRKKIGWTNSQVTTRIVLLHALVCGLYLFAIYCLMKR